MRIGIIGAGNVGSVLARLLVGVGYEVAISNSRGPASLTALVEQLGPLARAATAEEAAAFGEIVVEAIPYGRYRELPVAPLAGKIVVTAANYFPQRDGVVKFGGLNQSELVASHLAGARVVKAFNTIWFEDLQAQGDHSKALDERRVIFLSGDDAEAKAAVAALITAIGFGPLDLGSLHESSRQESDSPLFNKTMTVAEARARLGG